MQWSMAEHHMEALACKTYSEHSIFQLQALLSLLHSTGSQQNLALNTILWAQLLAGTGNPTLEDVTTSPSTMDPSIRKYLTHILGCITLE